MVQADLTPLLGTRGWTVGTERCGETESARSTTPFILDLFSGKNGELGCMIEGKERRSHDSCAGVPNPLSPCSTVAASKTKRDVLPIQLPPTRQSIKQSPTNHEK